MTEDRRHELASNLADVRARIAAACATAGRRPDGVTLVAVTKTWPATDAVHLRELGVLDLAENRDGEAREKAAQVQGVRWHFVGSVQTNKARSVAAYADVVHAVDRAALVAALSAGALRAGRTVEVLLQVSLDPPGSGSGRGGAQAHELPALAEAVDLAEGLRLRGLMAIAPLGVDPVAAFAPLPSLLAELAAVHPGAEVLSAGMSGDLEAAIAAGSTHVRVGTALLGHRPPVLR